MRTRVRPASRAGDSRQMSLHELAEDFEGLAFIVGSGLARLRNLLGGIESRPEWFRGATRLTYVGELERTTSRHEMLLAELKGLTGAAAATEIGDFDSLIEQKRTFVDLVRAEVGLAAAVMISTDWQSPSDASSVGPAAGRHAGSITAHHDDYKRDRHHDAAAFEKAYLDVNVGPEHRPEHTGTRAIMTSCGMSAFTTILGYLLLEDRLQGPVVMGRNTYHECAALLRSALGSSLIDVDEAQPGALAHAIETFQPRAVFLDSLCNTEGVVVPNLREAAHALARYADGPTYFVIDNSCLSTSFSPLSVIPLDAPHIHPIVFESLTKYPQLGLDRTTAGMILARGGDADALDSYREHLGTNVSEISPLILPAPNKAVIDRRLARLSRNAEFLARTLSEHHRVGYPSLPSHVSHAVATRLRFRGGFLTVSLPGGDPAAVTERALTEATRREIPLVAGTSFGFDTTRIYAVPGASGPFLRIAAGTETVSELPALADVLAETLRSTASKRWTHRPAADISSRSRIHGRGVA